MLEVNQFLQKEGIEKVTAITKRVGEYAIRRLVTRTPRDTGDTQNRWKVGINAPPLEDNVSQSVIADALGVISQLKDGDELWFANNSEHFDILEFGGFVPTNPGPSKDTRPHRFGRILVRDGFSVQAPKGIINITIEDIREFMEREVRE